MGDLPPQKWRQRLAPSQFRTAVLTDFRHWKQDYRNKGNNRGYTRDREKNGNYRKDQTLAELQNNMILVKMDLKKKTVCIAEQYHTVHALKEQPNSCKKRGGANMENQQPEKRSFLQTVLKTPLRQQLTPTATNSPYSCLMQSRQNPPRATPSKYRMKY
ncbi:UNVERIFIED_CONTAM: hypothetical protein FKN15_018390 [Acipenser sinensis]